MSTEKKDQLPHKYLEAESSLEEERTFLNDQEDGPLKPWARYTLDNSFSPPKDLSDRIGSSIDNRLSKRRTLFVGVSSIAATILIFSTLFVMNDQNSEQTFEEKQAILSQYINNETDQNILDESVLYEDDVIVIYYEQ